MSTKTEPAKNSLWNNTGRKFFLAILVLCSISLSFWFGKIDETTYFYGITLALAVYTGGNLIEKKIIN